MEHYRVMIAQSGKEDIKERKRYILSKFRYRTLAENFTQKDKKGSTKPGYITNRL